MSVDQFLLQDLTATAVRSRNMVHLHGVEFDLLLEAEEAKGALLEQNKKKKVALFLQHDGANRNRVDNGTYGNRVLLDARQIFQDKILIANGITPRHLFLPS